MQSELAPSETQQLPVVSPDGARSVLSIFLASPPQAPLALVLPAMGIEARYYDRFARALCAGGVSVALADLRGHGTSSLRASRRVDFGYGTLAGLDVTAYREALQRELGTRRSFIVGHSLGGQLALLHAAASPRPPEGLVLVATSSPYFRGYHGRQAWRVLLGTQASRLAAELVGHFPGQRLGFGGREARTLIREWAHVARTGHYRVAGLDDIEAKLRELEARVLSITLQGDDIAPVEACTRLLGKLPRARITRFHYDPTAHGLLPTGHNRWPREPAVIAQRVARFILGAA
jgi:predicted alpha/beta hydrolase